jgi:hypothetical protein
MKHIILSLLCGFAVAANAAPKALSDEDQNKYFDLGYKKNSSYAAKVDFAQLEYKKPLDKEFLKRITVENILAMDNEMADQLYARLTAGPIPDGVFDGYAGVLAESPIKSILHVLTGEESKRLFTPISPNHVTAMMDTLANTLWKGKQFFKSERALRNIIPKNDRAGLLLKTLVKGFDPNRLPVSTVNIHGGTVETWKLFPAKLYCGQSLLDSRRESVIIDYAYGDRISGYDSSIDFLATRHGIWIRDEIRMVRPGLYIGKAYMNKSFLLTFVLHNKAVESHYPNADWTKLEECWTGTQTRKISAN